MSGPEPGRRLVIDADLNLSIDGVEARLVGRDNALTLHTGEPARLSWALRRGGLPAALRQIEHRVPALASPSLTIEGPRGPVARVAPGTRGFAVRGLPTGTRLQLQRPQDLVPPAVRWVAVVTGLVIALVVRRLRRR